MLLHKKSKQVLFICFVFWIILCMMFSCDMLDKYNSVKELMSNYSHSNRIAYVSGEFIHLNDKTINYKKAKIEQSISKVLYVTSQKIYFCSFEKEKVKIFSSDYDFNNIVFIYEFNNNSTVLNISMYSEQEIRFVDDTGKKIYFIQENRMESVTDFPLIPKKYEIKSSDISKKENHIEVKNIDTDEKKILNNTQFTNIEQVKQLHKITDDFEFCYAIEHDAKIYLNFLSHPVMLTFLYDFETEEIKFIDWTENFSGVQMFFVS